MAGINVLGLTFDNQINWILSGGADVKVKNGKVELPPIDSQSLRHREIDFLQGLLFEYRESEPPTSVRLKELLGLIGEQLFDLAFRLETRECLASQIQALENNEIDLLRIELEFVGPEKEWLSTLPWEYIRTSFDFPQPAVFLSVLPTEIVLIRRLSPVPGATERSLEAAQPWRTLVVCCSPEDMDAGLAPVDSTYVREVLSQQRGAFDLIQDVLPRVLGGPVNPKPSWVTAGKVREAISKWQPHIVHFVGHGRRNNGVGELAFEAEGGQADWVPEDEVAMLMRGSNSLKLVFLQACESALPNPHLAMSGVAKCVAGTSVPAVVAMQDKVQPQAVNTFAQGFYTALAEPKSIDRAVKAGRDLLKQAGPIGQAGFGLPVLYLRGNYSGMKKPNEAPGTGPNVPSTRQRMKCPRPNCGTRNAADASCCSNCGLAFTCPELQPDGRVCGRRWLNPLANVCDKCRKPIVQPAWHPTGVQEPQKARFELVGGTGGSIAAAGGSGLVAPKRL